MEQVIKIVGLFLCLCNAAMKGGTRKSRVLSARLPSFPTPQGSINVFAFSFTSSVDGLYWVEAWLQVIIPSKGVGSLSCVVPMKIVLVGRTKTATLQLKSEIRDLSSRV